MGWTRLSPLGSRGRGAGGGEAAVLPPPPLPSSPCRSYGVAAVGGARGRAARPAAIASGAGVFPPRPLGGAVVPAAVPAERPVGARCLPAANAAPPPPPPPVRPSASGASVDGQRLEFVSQQTE